MKREVEKKEEVKKENEHMRSYLQHLINPIAQGNAAVPRPLAFPQETVEDFEEMKVIVKKLRNGWQTSIMKLPRSWKN